MVGKLTNVYWSCRSCVLCETDLIRTFPLFGDQLLLQCPETFAYRRLRYRFSPRSRFAVIACDGSSHESKLWKMREVRNRVSSMRI